MQSMTPAQTAAVIEAVKKAGYDPEFTRACMPASDLPKLGGVKGVRGCSEWDKCQFHLTRNGGFKGHTIDPKNIVMYVRPQADHPAQNELLQSCHDYVRYNRNRAADGRRDREELGVGEQIAIVAMEPCDYAKANGNPEGKCASCGFDHHYTHITSVPNPNSPTRELIEKVITQPVPKYKHPSQLAGTDGQRAMAQRAEGRGVFEEEVGPPRIKPQAQDKWDDETEADMVMGEGTAGA